MRAKASEMLKMGCSVGLVLVACVWSGCGGSGSGHRLLIEFFDFRAGGLSVVQDGGVDVLVAEEGFSAEPLLVIGEEDIESWPPPEEGPQAVYARLVVGEVTERLAELTSACALATPGCDLVFRLSIDDHSFWGFIQYIIGGSAAPQLYTPEGVGYPGFPWLVFPFGVRGEYGSFELVGGVTADGVSLSEAARQAWLD